MGGNRMNGQKAVKKVSKIIRASPLVEILSDRRVLIENYTGIAEYLPEKIILNVCYGSLEVTGAQLKLACMCKDRLVITGKISAVSLIRGC